MKLSSVSLRRFISLASLMLAAGLFTCLPSLTVAHAAKASVNTASADLVVSKSADETVPLGGSITYTISAYNAGPDDAVNVVVTDVIPAHTTFVDAQVNAGSVSFDGTTVTANFGTISFDNSATLTVTVKVNEDTPRGTTISNTADGTTTTPDSDTSNNSATALTDVSGPFAGDLLISEFRLSGPGGDTDEFIELYNNTDAPISVKTTDGSSGWAVAASDGIIRFTIPNGTTIPARGHFLGVNTASINTLRFGGVGNAGENLAAPIGDATYTSGIPNDFGIAVFRTATTENFSGNTRLDAVGSTADTNALYKEGTGYPAIGAGITSDYAFVRDTCGKAGSITVFGVCPTHGLPKDTDNNASDFYFVDTGGAATNAGQRLGAPGLEGLNDPITQNDAVTFFSLDRTVAASVAPNRVRDVTPDPANDSTFGTLEIRRRVVNNSGFPIARLRFRIIDISTLPAPAGIADLRARTSTDITVNSINDDATCPGGTTPCSVTVTGTTLESPSQLQGGGFNSSLSSDTITLPTPLAAGASLNVRFLLGVQQTGSFKFYINAELITDQSEPVEELQKAGRKMTRGQQRTAGVNPPTSTPQPVVVSAPRQTALQVGAASPFRFGAILNLNTPRDEATTTKKKKKRVKKVATTAKVN